MPASALLFPAAGGWCHSWQAFTERRHHIPADGELLSIEFDTPEEVLHAKVRSPASLQALAQFSANLADVHCYMCGPTEWMAVVAGALRFAGVPQEAIISEEFTPPGGVVDVDYASHDLLAVPRTATFLTTGSGGGDREVHVLPGKTLLAEAREAGVAVPYSCQSGACKLCRATLCSGAVLDLEDGVVVTEPGSTVLTCRAVPATDISLKLF